MVDEREGDRAQPRRPALSGVQHAILPLRHQRAPAQRRVHLAQEHWREDRIRVHDHVGVVDLTRRGQLLQRVAQRVALGALRLARPLQHAHTRRADDGGGRIRAVIRDDERREEAGG